MLWDIWHCFACGEEWALKCNESVDLCPHCGSREVDELGESFEVERNN